MNKNAIILGAILTVSLVASVWASRAGWGAARPRRNPPSLREESVRQGGSGHGRHVNRYFIGGGFIRGK